MKIIQAFTEGHPDKVCDQIADAIVDEYLRRDPKSHVNVSVMGSHGMVMIGGEVCSQADFDAGALAKKVYKEIGYDDEIEPFVNIHVEQEHKQSHGAHGTVVVSGYATRETREFMPRPVVLGNTITRRLDDLRKNDAGFSWLRPDGKVQLIMDGSRVRSITVLVQHSAAVDHATLQQMICDRVIVPILGPVDDVWVSVNPIGCFSKGGLGFDTGATNRKVSEDTYGGLIPFGGAGLSGKDPGCTERSAAYMARFVAKSLVVDGAADNVLVRVAFSLGKPDPVFLEAKSGCGKDLTTLVSAKYDFRNKAIQERLNLNRPIYRRTASYGHFGKPDLPWENVA